MKKIILSVIVVLFMQTTFGQPPAGKVKAGTTYGGKINPANAIAASELPSLLKTKDTINVKVKATVLDVCSEKGCWMTFKINDTTEAFVKMKDYGFFVPVSLTGKTVVIEGKSFIKTTPVEDLKHYAEDAKKSQAEIDAITEPKRQIRLLAHGIVVVK